jgi:biotin carboxyl carrier protein
VKYLVSVAGRELEVEIDGERVTAGGREFTASLTAVPGTPLRQLWLSGRPTGVGMEDAGRGHWTVTVRGDRWETEVIDERTRNIRSLTGASPRPQGPAVLRAPMPGLVVRVLVEPGQLLAVGAGVLVLEAMKMENELRAHAAARVRAVRVRPGEAVEKGQVLAEFDPGT